MRILNYKSIIITRQRRVQEQSIGHAGILSKAQTKQNTTPRACRWRGSARAQRSNPFRTSVCVSHQHRNSCNVNSEFHNRVTLNRVCSGHGNSVLPNSGDSVLPNSDDSVLPNSAAGALHCCVHKREGKIVID